MHSPAIDCMAAKAALEKTYGGMAPEANESAFFLRFARACRDHDGLVLEGMPTDITLAGRPMPMMLSVAWFRQGPDDALLAAFYSTASGDYGFISDSDEAWPEWMDALIRPVLTGIRHAEALAGRGEWNTTRQ